LRWEILGDMWRTGSRWFMLGLRLWYVCLMALQGRRISVIRGLLTRWVQFFLLPSTEVVDTVTMSREHPPHVHITPQALLTWSRRLRLSRDRNFHHLRLSPLAVQEEVVSGSRESCCNFRPSESGQHFRVCQWKKREDDADMMGFCQIFDIATVSSSPPPTATNMNLTNKHF
jgi:hypothetical protein